MSEAREIKIRVDKFRVASNAMRQLAAKSLAAESELKFPFSLAAYERFFDATTKVLQKIDADFSRPTPRGKVLTTEGEKRQARVLASMLTIKLPPAGELFMRDDLPKKADEEGDIANRAASAL